MVVCEQRVQRIVQSERLVKPYIARADNVHDQFPDYCSRKRTK